MEPLVSIAIATHNGEQFLEEQLASIYNQTYRNIEIVVSDDVSKDRTIDILKKYNKSHGLAYTVNADRLGVTKNFENAIKQCNGKYILLSDQDDVWLPNKIELMIRNIRHSSLIYSDGRLLEASRLSESKLSEQKWIKLFGLDSRHKDIYKYLLLNNFILGCSVMFDRDILNLAFPFYENEQYHDWWLAMCALNCNGITFLDEVLVKYRVHATNFSLSLANEDKSKKFLRKISDFFSNETQGKRKKRKTRIEYAINYFRYNEKDRFMRDMLVYSKTKNGWLNFTDFFMTMKYSRFFFPNKPRYLQFFASFLTLFKK